MPKELLPLANYPAIHYVLEETVASGIYEIGIIISKAKKLIKLDPKIGFEEGLVRTVKYFKSEA